MGIQDNTKLREVHVTVQSARHERCEESGELKRIAAQWTTSKALCTKGWTMTYAYPKETEMHRFLFFVDKDAVIEKHEKKIVDKDVLIEKYKKAIVNKDALIKMLNMMVKRYRSLAVEGCELA